MSHPRVWTDVARHLAALTSLLWWAPTLALALAALLAGRIRFRAVLAVVDLLVVLGRRGAAGALLRAEVRRCERRLR